MNETKLAANAIQRLRELGAMCERVQSGQAFGRRGGLMHLASTGTPDWLVVHRGIHLIEFKVPGGELSTDQAKWHARARALGASAHVVRSVKEAVFVVFGGGE